MLGLRTNFLSIWSETRGQISNYFDFALNSFYRDRVVVEGETLKKFLCVESWTRLKHILKINFEMIERAKMKRIMIMLGFFCHSALTSFSFPSNLLEHPGHRYATGEKADAALQQREGGRDAGVFRAGERRRRAQQTHFQTSPAAGQSAGLPPV